MRYAGLVLAAAGVMLLAVTGPSYSACRRAGAGPVCGGIDFYHVASIGLIVIGAALFLIDVTSGMGRGR